MAEQEKKESKKVEGMDKGNGDSGGDDAHPDHPCAPLLLLFLTLWVSLLLTSRVLSLFPLLLQGNMNMTPTPSPTPTLTRIEYWDRAGGGRNIV